MSHSEDDVCFLDSDFHLETIFNASSHRLLAQDVVPLFREGESYLEMHMVVDGDNNSVCEALAHRLDCFSGSCV